MSYRDEFDDERVVVVERGGNGIGISVRAVVRGAQAMGDDSG